MRDVVDTLEAEVGPAMREVLDMAPAGSAMRERIAAAMGTLDSVYSIAVGAASAQRPARYVIADAGDTDFNARDGGDGGGGGMATWNNWWGTSGGDGWPLLPAWRLGVEQRPQRGGGLVG